jgi:hypothetical protein
MAEAPERRAGKVRKIIAIALAVLCGSSVMSLVAWGLFVGFERPLDANDREVLVTFERLAASVEGLQKAPNSETTQRKRFIDGSYEISYDYDAKDLSISSSVNHERTARDARQLFAVMSVGMPAALKLASDVAYLPRKDLYSGGDDRYSAALMSNGIAAGHVLVVLQGKDVFFLTIGGAFVDSPAEFRALVQPRLDALKRLH